MDNLKSSSGQYDVVIVGAGPAGLSAARTMARLGFSTVVLEQMSAAGQLIHPCSAILAPVPGFLRGRRLLGDLFYPELDLLIPLSLIVGYPRLHRFISPSGIQAEAPYARADSCPVAAIDKGGLLQLMADQAGQAGADMRWGTVVTGLIKEGTKVVGARTPDGEYRAPIVLCAEGAARRLSREAGLFRAEPGASALHALIVTRELVAPNVRRQHLGQITTFGRRYSSARRGFGSVVMPLPGRASVSFTLLSEGPNHHTPSSASYYLDEYAEQDPRVSDLLAGATVLDQASASIAIDRAPVRSATHGFIAMGDAATPAGHIGILPALYLGRKAALVAAEALDTEDFSAARLNMYGRLFQNRMLRVLNAERDMMVGLAELPDDELDRLAMTVAGMPMSAPFFGGWHGIPWESTRLLAKRYPELSYRSSLLERILAGEDDQVVLPPGLFPANVRSRTSVA